MRNIIPLSLLIILLIGCNETKKSTPLKLDDVYFSSADTLEYSIDNEGTLIGEDALKNTFSLTFWNTDTLMLWGNQPLNKHLYLLNFKSGKAHKVKTTTHATQEDPILGKLELTAIEPSLFRDNINLDIAVIPNTKNIDFKLVDTHIITDEQTRKEMDQRLKTTANLASLSNELNKAAVSRLPEMHVAKNKHIEVTIASYRSSDGSTSGPRFAIYNDLVYPLTGACSLQKFTTYTINGIFYIKTGTRCCNCGEVEDLIYKINDNELSLDYSDKSRSI